MKFRAQRSGKSLGALVCLALASTQASAGQLSWSGVFQYSQFTDRFQGAESYSISPGLRYDEGEWYAGAYLPILFQTQDTMARMGQITVPTGSSGSAGGATSGHMDGAMGSIRPAPGDLYVNGAYRIRSEEGLLPAAWIIGQVKAPTAMSGFGTGAWDFGSGLGLRKTFGSWLGFADISYLLTGDPSENVYSNPVVYGLGAGPVLGDGLWSLLAYYQGSSPVLAGLPGQSQLTLGINFKASESLYLSATVGRGFSDSVPRISGGAGISYYLQ